MEVELLYLYVGENNTSVKNIDICFSHKYKIEYKDKILNIEKTDNYLYDGFYGKYVKSCSLIVGRNGSGKTTLLNFLGLLSNNLYQYYSLKERRKKGLIISEVKYNCNDYGCWFALYMVDNHFYIEGYNFERLFGISEFNGEPISFDFGLFIDYDFKTKNITINNFINDTQTSIVDYFYFKRLPESSVADFNEMNREYSYRNDQAGQDKTIRLNRREIISAKINNIYRLFENENNILFDNKFGQKSKITITNNDFYNDSLDEFDSIIKSKFNFKDQEKANSTKEKYIENLYYELAYGLWNAYLRRYSEKNNLELDNILPKKLIESNREIAIHCFKEIRVGLNRNIPEYVKILDNYVDLLKEVDDKYFKNVVLIEIPLTQHDIAVQNILDYLCNLSDEESLESLIKMEYSNLSSGEHEYLEVFGSLNKILSEIKSGNKCKNRILILDEPDRTFHPEWTSNYIYNLVKILNRFGEKTGVSFQVIISTHSPFMVTDILKEDIYKIDNKNGCSIVKSDYGFASNYYDIINDNFFLSDSVGKFAKHKIQEFVQQINDATNLSDLIDVKKYIDLIGDEYIRNILMSNYNKKISTINIKENLFLLKRQIDEKETELNSLKELLKKYE